LLWQADRSQDSDFVTRLWNGQPGHHGLPARHKRFFSSPKHPDCPQSPQRYNGYQCCSPQVYIRVRGMRLRMRTAVTANFTLASSGFE
jgi:hypothetical protein